MEDQKLPPCDRFKSNLLALIEDVRTITQTAEEKKVKTVLTSALIELALPMIGIADANDIIEKFIEKSASYWDSILAKDEDFIRLNAKVLFAELPEKYVNGFVDIYFAQVDGKALVDEEMKKQIWTTIHGMVKICIRHVHLNRIPKTNDAGVTRYTVNYFPSLKLKSHAEKWRLQL